MEKVNKKLNKISQDKDLWMLYDWKERWKEEAKLVAEYEVENERIEKVVKNMLNKKMSIDLISEITGLSLEEINKIKDIN